MTLGVQPSLQAQQPANYTIPERKFPAGILSIEQTKDKIFKDRNCAQRKKLYVKLDE
jgi:hypothetical protein